MRPLVPALAAVAILLPGLAWGDYVLPNTAANRARGVAGCTQTASGISRAPSGGGGGGYSYGGVNMMMGLMNSFMQGVERGIQLYNDGNYQGAFNAFNQALQYSPGDSNIRGNLNQAREALNRQREEAEQRDRAQMEAARVKKPAHLVWALAQIAAAQATGDIGGAETHRWTALALEAEARSGSGDMNVLIKSAQGQSALGAGISLAQAAEDRARLIRRFRAVE